MQNKSNIYGLVLALSLLMVSGAFASDYDIDTILDSVDDTYRGDSSYAVVTMKIVTENWERELEMETWNEGEDLSLIRILSPKKEAGTATLRNDVELWNYLPKTDRVIKLPASMMSQSWMGSDFTNDDLVKYSRMADDYVNTISFVGKDGDVDIVRIECIPKEDAVVEWGKLEVEVRQANLLPYAIKYYDEDLELARTMLFEDVQEMDGRTIPVSMKLIPADDENKYTEVRYKDIDFNVEIEQDTFSIRNLKSR